MAVDNRSVEDLSDEELSAMTPEQFATMAGGEVVADADEQAEEVAPAEAEVVSAVTDEAKADEDGDEEGSEEERAEAASGVAPEAGKEAKAADPKPEPVADKPKPADAALDFEAEFKKLTAPFKANGRDMQVGTVDEAIQLMQMGANYNRKMAALKPKLALSRMLENAGLNEEQLSFLIDVHKKDPAAINKLVKDSGIDPMDLSAEKAEDYKPGNHGVSTAEVELDQVLEEIKDSPAYAQTLDVVGTKWDTESKAIAAKNPQLIKIINDQIESGIYGLISTAIERERTFGRLSGLSDLEAYRQVGDAMHAKGAFAHLGVAQPQSQQTAAPQVIAPANPQKADDSKRNEKKRAAMPAKGAAPAAQDPNFNPLSLSDEDFAKFKLKS